MEKLGECSVTAAQLKQVKATLSPGCAFELKQAHQEKRLPLTITNACQFKISTPTSNCDLSVEPKGNNERNSTSITSNAILQPSLSGVSTTAGGSGCKTDGIESSAEGQITGIWVIEGVQVQPIAEFIVGSTRLRFSPMLTKGIVTITDRGVPQSPRKWTQVESPAASFEPNGIEEAECKAKSYGTNETCLFATVFKKAGWQLFEVESTDGGVDGVILTGI